MIRCTDRPRRSLGEPTRRQFVRTAAIGAGLVATQWLQPPRLPAKDSARHFVIADIERVTVRVPYRETPARSMDRELPHWRYSEIVTVTLKNGVRGFGETLLYYTWGATRDDDVQRARGQNAASIMWDDTLGAGLQMALFDAVARSLDAPIHALLGTQVHRRTPLSWWNIDTSAADMAAECLLAKSLGYHAYKTKGRPWFDLDEQMTAASRVVPDWFKIDMDFNDTLLNAEQALPILGRLAENPRVAIFETPIPQSDIRGNQTICQATDVAVAMHYGDPSPDVAIKESVCDGFVVGGGASRLMKSGHTAASADLPFWLQLVGTGITAAWSLHFGGVLSHATWPAVNCHQLYTHTLLTKPIELNQGVAEVPTTPGLGYEIDWDVVKRFTVAKPARRPDPPRLIETTWSDGSRMYLANNGRVNFMLDAARFGKMPFYQPGADTRLVPNDNSARWRDLYQQARRGPVLVLH